MLTWAIVCTMAKKQEGATPSIGAQMVAARYAKMTPEERSAAARNAAVKRWEKAKKKNLGKRGQATAQGRSGVAKAPKHKEG